MESPREVWERIFAIDWWGVYYCARAFLPLLIASGDGVLAGDWRILIGQDARMIDAAVRAKPEAAYDYAELFAGLGGTGDETG